MIYLPINNNLKRIRKLKHVRQEDLARAIGSCARTISRIEQGERNPSLEIALRIAEYLNTPVEDIFTVSNI